MNSAITLEFTNLKQFRAAMKLAPKRVVGGIRRKMKTAGNKIAKLQRTAAFDGGRGINLPARKTKSLKGGGLKILKSRTGNKSKIQKQHLVSKVNRTGNPVLVNYSSIFAGYFEPKLRPVIEGIFRANVPRLNRDIEKEAARIGQAVLDKGLSDRGTR